MSAWHLGNWSKLSSQARRRSVWLSVWCVRRGDKANCRLAYPLSKKFWRPAKKLILSHFLFLTTSPKDIKKPEGDIWVAQLEKSGKSDVDVALASEYWLV